jgi:hypothetical protein
MEFCAIKNKVPWLAGNIPAVFAHSAVCPLENFAAKRKSKYPGKEPTVNSEMIIRQRKL